MRHAHTTSGTFHHHKPQEKKETIPERRNVIPKETICLNTKSDKNISNIKSSRSPIKELITNFEKLQQKSRINHKTSTPREVKSQVGNTKKLAETFIQTSRNESFPDHPSIRNSNVDGKSVPRRQAIPGDGQNKPVSSRKVWAKLKSGLFGWKYSKSVSVSPKPSHDKISNIPKISTQTKIKNFEAKSVPENLQIIPPKITLGGRESSKIMKTSFGNNSNGEGLNLLAEKLSSVLRSGGQNDGHLGTKKIGGEI